MRLFFAALAALAWTGCTHSEPSVQEDSCAVRFHAYEAARTATPCETDADCVFAPGIAPPQAQEGHMGAEPGVCGSATVASSLPQLEALIEGWRAASCGPVGAPGSSACAAFSHGARVACRDAVCTALY